MDWTRGSERKIVKAECKLEVRCGHGKSCKFLHEGLVLRDRKDGRGRRLLSEEVMEKVRFWAQNLR